MEQPQKKDEARGQFSLGQHVSLGESILFARISALSFVFLLFDCSQARQNSQAQQQADAGIQQQQQQQKVPAAVAECSKAREPSPKRARREDDEVQFFFAMPRSAYTHRFKVLAAGS